MGANRARRMDAAVSLRSVTEHGRAAAAAIMVDHCLIERPGDPELDRLTGDLTPAPTTVYIGRCRVQTWQPQEYTPEVAGHTATTQRYSVHVPVGAGYAPEVSDVVLIDSAALDPNLVGRRFRVLALLHKTAATAYRLAVSDQVD